MPQPSDDVKPIADALRNLSPAPAAISRDRLLFEAGRASARSTWGWLWKAGTLFFSGLSLSLGYGWYEWTPEPTIIERERILEVKSPGLSIPALPAGKPSGPGAAITPELPLDESPNPNPSAMWKIRNDVLTFGPEMLPQTRPVWQQPATDLDRWLGIPIRSLAGSPSYIPPVSKKVD